MCAKIYYLSANGKISNFQNMPKYTICFRSNKLELTQIIHFTIFYNVKFCLMHKDISKCTNLVLWLIDTQNKSLTIKLLRL